MIQDFLLALREQLVVIIDLLAQWLELHIINIIAILIGAWFVRRFGAKIIGRVLHVTIRRDLYPSEADREKRVKTLDTLAGAIMRVGVYIIAAVLIIGEINPAYTTAIFAGIGFIGVAIGFGAKDLINDFMSGIFIITENQYRVGDVIEIADTSGTVEDITVRTTVLRDLAGDVHHIPNGSITVTTNKTLGYSGIDEKIVLGLDTDIDEARHIINHVGTQLAADADFQKKIIEAPHFLRVDGYEDNGLVFRVVGKVTSGDQWDVKGALYERLHKALTQHKITIPYKHIAIHTEQSKTKSAKTN